MSDKFEYSDFYKFVTSVGVGLIVLSFAVPWAFLREHFDFLVADDSMRSLAPGSREIVIEQQHIASFIFRHMTGLSTGLFFVGFVFFVAGSGLWIRRQFWRDRAENAATQKAEQELQPMTTAEVNAKADAEAVINVLEIGDAEGVLPVVPAAVGISDAAIRYREIENRLQATLSKSLSPPYTVLTNQRLGPIEFDFVLQQQEILNTADVVIELKVRSKSPTVTWTIESASRALVAAQAYSAATHRAAAPILLVILSGDSPVSAALRATLVELAKMNSSLAEVKIWIFSEREFFEKDRSEYRSLFTLDL